MEINPLIIPIMIFSIPIIAIVGGFYVRLQKIRAEERQASVSADETEFFHRSLTRLEDRVKTLEAILDDEAPGWRNRHRQEIDA